MDNNSAPKKISFGFNKLKKPAPALAKPKPPEEQIHYIDCLEGNSIKLLDGIEPEEKKPLVIPLKDKDRTSTVALLARIAKEVEPKLQMKDKENSTVESQTVAASSGDVAVVDNNESLEARAARELLEEARNAKIKEDGNSTFVVPIVSQAKLTGEKESSLEDYEDIPVIGFGMAMLRGMGWKEGATNKSNKKMEDGTPKVRPKGLGLGADKVTPPSTNDEEKELVKGSYVKFTAGKHTGTYGQIISLGDLDGRVMVKAEYDGGIHNISESMVTVVSKEEFSKPAKATSKTDTTNSKENNHYRHKEKRDKSKYRDDPPYSHNKSRHSDYRKDSRSKGSDSSRDRDRHYRY